MTEVASLRYGVIFKKAFSVSEIFTAFVQDLTGAKMEVDKVETEKSFDPPIGHVYSALFENRSFPCEICLKNSSFQINRSISVKFDLFPPSHAPIYFTQVPKYNAVDDCSCTTPPKTGGRQCLWI